MSKGVDAVVAGEGDRTGLYLHDSGRGCGGDGLSGFHHRKRRRRYERRRVAADRRQVEPFHGDPVSKGRCKPPFFIGLFRERGAMIMIAVSAGFSFLTRSRGVC